MEITSIKKEIYSIAIPMTTETLLETIVGSIDVWIVSQLGLAEVTAVGISNNLMAIYLAIFMALGVGTNTLLSEKIGANQWNDATIFTKQILWITALVGGILGGVTLLFGTQLLAGMGLTGDLVTIGYTYSALVGGTAFLMGWISIISNILRVVGDAKFPLKVSALVNILNAVLSLIFAFSCSLGVVGAALGTVLSRVVGVLILYCRLKKTMLSSPSSNSSFSLINADAKTFVKVTLPTLAERMFMRGGQVIYMTMIVSISSVTYAAHNIAGTIETFTYIPAYGFAAAATILVARSIGEKNEQHRKQSLRISLTTSVFILTIFAVIQWGGAPIWVRIFTQDQAVLPLIIRALQISAICQPFIAISQVLAGALQGASDTRSPFYSTVIGMFAIRMTGIYWFGIQLEWGITGVWIAILIDLIF